jgi:choline dehydrogenase
VTPGQARHAATQAGPRTWTHIVVGGGTAGCVVAARLSQEPESRVLLLEAGGRPLDPCLRVPLGLLAINYRRHWQYEVEPDTSRDGTREVWPAGRTLGGTSAINGMLWSRGARTDYDGWAAQGLDGWSYADAASRFIASERAAGEHLGGGSAARGTGGPIRVAISGCQEPLAREFLESARAAGHASNPDYNDGASLGAAPMQIARSRRLRQDTYTRYLARGRRRSNLRVVRHAYVSQIIAQGGRAVGVSYQQGGHERRAYCDGEVILCAGAIGSPAILLRSGIGPAPHLTACGVPVVADLPGVGGNLRNHPLMTMMFEVSRPTLNNQTSLPHLLAEAARYLAGREGLLTTGPSHAIVYGSIDGTRPDFSITHGAYAVGGPGRGPLRRFMRPADEDAVTLRIQLFDSESRGTVRLRTAAPQDKPVIKYAALGGRRDVARMTAACREARRIALTPPLSHAVLRELKPGAAVRTDDDWEAALRRQMSAGRHYGGTCAMGPEERAVVDTTLRVHGVPNIRIADASVMPELPSGGLYAPTVMIAERAAEFVAATICGRRDQRAYASPAVPRD